MACDRKIGPYDCCSVVCGDCLELMCELPDGCIDAVVTDPPYNVSVRGGRTDTTNGRIKRKDGTFREIVREFGDWDFDFRPEPFLAETRRLLREGGSLVAFTSEFLIADYLNSGLDHRSLIYWHKSNPAPNFRRLYSRCIEMAVWQTKGAGWTFNGGGYVPNCIKEPILSGYRAQNVEAREHPTQKPLEVMDWILCTHTNPGDVVLEPFGGSGTTCAAAKRGGRHFLGFEVSPEYCAIAQSRISRIEAQPSLFVPKPEQLNLENQ